VFLFVSFWSNTARTNGELREMQTCGTECKRTGVSVVGAVVVGVHDDAGLALRHEAVRILATADALESCIVVIVFR
jgi:hypothetical protein